MCPNNNSPVNIEEKIEEEVKKVLEDAFQTCLSNYENEKKNAGKYCKEAYKLLGDAPYRILMIDEESKNNSKNNLENILEYEEKFEARDAFVKFLKQKHDDITNNEDKKNEDKNPKLIGPKAYLGPDGYELYKKARIEERDSNEFKSKGFINTLTKKKNDANEKPIENKDINEDKNEDKYEGFVTKTWPGTSGVMLVGPAASGKSTIVNSLLSGNTVIDTELSSAATKKDKPKLISICDGEIERDSSLIRDLLKLSSEANGYGGIEGIDKCVKKRKLKKNIRNACDAAGIHQIYVETAYKEKIMKKFHNKNIDDNSQMAFVRVSSDKITTQISGEKRASRKDKKQGPAASKEYGKVKIFGAKINEKTIPLIDKYIFPTTSYSTGKKKADDTVEYAKSNLKDPLIFDYHNDAIFMDATNNEKIVSLKNGKDNPNLVRMSERLFKYYTEHQKDDESIIEINKIDAAKNPYEKKIAIEKWVKDAAADPNLQPLVKSIITRENVQLFKKDEKFNDDKKIDLDIEIYNSQKILAKDVEKTIKSLIGEEETHIADMRSKQQDLMLDGKEATITVFRVPMKSEENNQQKAKKVHEKSPAQNIVAVNKEGSTAFHASAKAMKDFEKEENYETLYNIVSKSVAALESNDVTFTAGPKATVEWMAMLAICCEQKDKKITFDFAKTPNIDKEKINAMKTIISSKIKTKPEELDNDDVGKITPARGA